MPQTEAPTRTIPTTRPETQPERRYSPSPDHCPNQRVRTVRRIRRLIEP